MDSTASLVQQQSVHRDPCWLPGAAVVSEPGTRELWNHSAHLSAPMLLR